MWKNEIINRYDIFFNEVYAPVAEKAIEYGASLGTVSGSIKAGIVILSTLGKLYWHRFMLRFKKFVVISNQ